MTIIRNGSASINSTPCGQFRTAARPLIGLVAKEFGMHIFGPPSDARSLLPARSIRLKCANDIPTHTCSGRTMGKGCYRKGANDGALKKILRTFCCYNFEMKRRLLRSSHSETVVDDQLLATQWFAACCHLQDFEMQIHSARRLPSGDTLFELCRVHADSRFGGSVRV